METMVKEKSVHKPVAVTTVLLILVLIFTLVFKRPWLFFAAPMGFLFGFFLQRGFMCPASACSEVVLFKSWERLIGLACCMVAAMMGYALLEWFDWVKLDPMPLHWLSLLTGGTLFGVGMVLTGGCVVGVLFKAGTGNLNSLAALPAVLGGVYMVREGWLGSVYGTLKSHTLTGPETLMELTGAPFIGLAGIGAVLFLILVLWKKPIPKTWKAGAAIGVLAPVSCLCASAAGYQAPLGATDGVLNLVSLAAGKSIISPWPLLFCAFIMLGSWFSGGADLRPKPKDELLTAVGGGLLLGIGAALSDGCFYGNIIAGWARFNVGGFIFALMVIPAAWVTTYFYLMGGSLGQKKQGGSP